jgi:hypothetical protein
MGFLVAISIGQFLALGEEPIYGVLAGIAQILRDELGPNVVRLPDVVH